MKPTSTQVRGLLLAGLALLALIGLAATLNTLELSPGSTMPFWDMRPQLFDPTFPEGWQRAAMAVLRAMLLVMWLLLPIFLLLMIFSKRFRKQFLRDMIFYVPILIALYMMYRARGSAAPVPAEDLLGEGFNLGELQPSLADSAAAPVFTPPDPAVTNLLTTLIAIGLVAAVAAVGWHFYRRSKARALEPLRSIHQEAQAALDELEAGGDLRDVIMRAYLQMSEALARFRNIHRDHDMTPHEFETYLTSRGLPSAPVHQLTELFERVRYGAAVPGRADERAAVSSLSAIVAAIQREGADKR